MCSFKNKTNPDLRQTSPPLLLTVLGRAETGQGDIAGAGARFRQALTAGMEMQKVPTVAITLLCCAEWCIARSNALPDGAMKAGWLREAYTLAGFIMGRSDAWKATRDAAAAMMGTLAVQTAGQLPCDTLDTVIERTLGILNR